MKKRILLCGALILSLLLGSAMAIDWGFYGHRKINRLAVFTLPQEMLTLYKKNIEWLTDHAVDPDKRRYATKHEAVRHYIDVDHWGENPFELVPIDFNDALIRFMNIELISNEGLDTTLLFSGKSAKIENGHLWGEQLDIYLKEFNPWFKDNVRPIYYEDDWIFEAKDVRGLFTEFDFKEGDQLKINDEFSGYGILPYHLFEMYFKLIGAFEKHDLKRILRTSAEFGHYIGDGHVPLHTTENYNGQLTDQNGIHGFWESRLPELFADETYDFFVGKAEYIDDPKTYFWDVIKVSHSHLDSVLAIEKRLSITFPQDQQYCYEERNDRTIRMQCEAYCTAYHNAMEGMVEKRMRDAILSIGSVWYSAWVDAGQPDLSKMGKDYVMTDEEKKRQEELEKAFQSGENKGRAHSN